MNIKISLLAPLCFFSNSLSACPQLQGDYDMQRTTDKGQQIMTLRQNECDIISIGTYFLKDGKKIDEKPPKISMIRKGVEASCEIMTCQTFEDEGSSLGVQAKGFVVLDSGESCTYNFLRVKAGTKNELIRDFFLNDAKEACKAVGVHRITWLQMNSSR